MKYDFSKIEKKWQKRWRAKKIYEPDLQKAKNPFYNLMMFPYPSAEGLHVGNMYAFVGSDIYGRMKRMQKYDVFQPMGLDGFGIHSENYALKIGAHPMKQAKISQERFYKQLEMIGNGFAWNERLETYDPNYYKWTQWIFVQMFKHGLAYRKRQAVNWCPKDLTVLADEQVVAGKCERCGAEVIKKDLEQWFFRITKYADRLLMNLDKIDWSEKVKIAQRNWIGRSEGALIDFKIKNGVASSYVLLHGYAGSPKTNFFPWLKKELEKRGAKVYAPKLSNTNDPRVYDQVTEVLRSTPFNENTVLVGHSLGGVVAMKILEKLKKPVKKTILVASFTENKFFDENFPLQTFDWKFDVKKIQSNAGSIHILRDTNDDMVPQNQAESVRDLIGGVIFDFVANEPHATGKKEPEILSHCVDSLKIFTTRPDTLFGATYMVLSPEHRLIKDLEHRIKNLGEVKKYIEATRKKIEEDKISEDKGKTGIELKGVKAINPANKKEIPIFIADYVLSSYGTGAIMAVPAHDERDFEFAKRYKLPVLEVVSPLIDTDSGSCLPAGRDLCGFYDGEGKLINSGKFDGMDSKKARLEITKFISGKHETQYRLRDWLISRQRYWGPPIPMIFCEKCSWQSVPEKDLPVKLPFVKDFGPKGKDESPLASVKEFYETKCPKCRGKARRETDVSDTFLDSAWYYLRYPSIRSARSGQAPWDLRITKKWLPASFYTGGAEHSVLHLLYVRFVALAMQDMGLLDFSAKDRSFSDGEEPFPKFRAHGLLIKEGAKMSKSKGNIVNPDFYIKEFGADTLRMYLMFLAPFEQGGDFRDQAVLGIWRFLERVWKLFHENRLDKPFRNQNLLHATIKKITDDIENLRYNTAISALMILLRELEMGGSKEEKQIFLKLLAPFAPYITEELWHEINPGTKSIHLESWPIYDKELVKAKTFSLIVQVNGKLRASFEVSVSLGQKEAEALALNNVNVSKLIQGQKIRNIIYVPDRLINIVI